MVAEWFAFEVPAGLRVTQVYGFLFDDRGRVLVQDDRGRFNLPGGKPEPGEPDYLTVLRRESLEESQVVVGDASYLGYVRVEEPGAEPFAQVRMVGLIDTFLPVAPDPATGRAYRRRLAPIEGVADLLAWGEHGSAQARSAAAEAPRSLGITLAPADEEGAYVDD